MRPSMVYNTGVYFGFVSGKKMFAYLFPSSECISSPNLLYAALIYPERKSSSTLPGSGSVLPVWSTIAVKYPRESPSSRVSLESVLHCCPMTFFSKPKRCCSRVLVSKSSSVIQ